MHGEDVAGSLAFEMTSEGAMLNVPREAPDAFASVIKLEFSESPRVEQPLPAPNAAGIVHLPASVAAIVNAYDGNARLFDAGEKSYIGDWTKSGTALHWEFAVPEPAEFAISVEVASAEGGAVAIVCDGERLTARIEQNQDAAAFRWPQLGRINVAAGERAIELKADTNDWSEVRLRAVRLVRVERSK